MKVDNHHYFVGPCSPRSFSIHAYLYMFNFVGFFPLFIPLSKCVQYLLTHFRKIIDSIEVIMMTIMTAPTPRVLASLLAVCTVHIHYFIKSSQPNDVLLVRVISEETKLWSI